MAIMINCATDWTMDEFAEDCKKYSALAIKGVHCRKDASSREIFVRSLKRDFKKFLEEEGDSFSPYTHIDEKFRYFADKWLFSDYYKDVYGQRPHCPAEMYVVALGFKSDKIRFCMPSAEADLEDYIKSAKRVKEQMW